MHPSVNAVAALAIGLAAFAVSSATSFATVYSGEQQIGDITASYTITTDGTLGVLSAANITGFTSSLTNGTETTNVQTPTIDLTGDALSATVNSLIFDYADIQTVESFLQIGIDGSSSPVNTGTIDFEAPFTISFGGHTFQGSGSDSAQIAMGNNSVDTQSAHQSGFQTIATVPEPATWALMLAGMGALGFARRRRAAVSPSQA